jgi:glycosyltransferase involved in cell wall biosynthesis
MKILWIGRELRFYGKGNSGSWLHALYQKNVELNLFELGNVAQSNTSEILYNEEFNLKQWLIPNCNFKKKHLQSKHVNYYLDIIKTFNPDIIHVWGTESIHPGLIKILSNKKIVILEIQGLLGPISDFIYAGLNGKEIFETIGLKEILKLNTLYHIKKQMNKWSFVEKEIITNSKYICAPSEWMRMHIMFINQTAKIFQNHLPVRLAINNAQKWMFKKNYKIFMSSAYSSSFKGFHIAIKALFHVKKIFPTISLRIAGPHIKIGIRKDGYINFVEQLILKYDLTDNVIWLGEIGESEIVNELQNANIMLLPSFVESYGAAHAEAMFVGTPCVCSFNQGSSYLATNNFDSLFFSPGDYIHCAGQIVKLLTNEDLAIQISNNAIHSSSKRNNLENVYFKQFEIYSSILNE